MKRFLRILLILLILLAAFVLQILHSGGFFRKVVPGFEGNIIQKINLPGAEDIAISREDRFLIVSSDDRASRWGKGKPRQGGLFMIDLSAESFTPKLLTGAFDSPFYPHGISLLRLDSALHQILAINHANGGHTIEVFLLYGDSLVYEKTLADESMISPNDVVAISVNAFYFTNDHRHTSGTWRLMEDYLGLRQSNVVYASGSSYREVDHGIAYANGINYDPTRNLLFVASPRDFLIKVYSVNSQGDLTFIEDIQAGTGVDNIEFDDSGNLWIGAHPNLMKFASYAAGKSEKAPSEVIQVTYRGIGDYEVSSVFLDDGAIISASTVAVPFTNLIFIGNVMDNELVVWKR
ncbi:hypothetical protein [Marinoscillum sp.]|uniref:hypothetical protein n=1 Tax=Marinoscillum sp. TaxID=2024838 RepID=UPI003BA94DCB